jgi:hypothetical protein
LWHRQPVLCGGTQGRQALHLPDAQSLGRPVGTLLGQIIRSYPYAHTIHLVMDNLNIHGRKTLTDYFGEQPGGALWQRLTVHYTPKHGSWLNQAEIEISLFARQCLGKRRIPSLSLLRREARAWNRMVNRKQVTIDWRFTRIKARQKFNYDKNSFMRLQA